MPIPPTGGTLCANISTMKIGDFIRCGYTAASGAAGHFHSFGDQGEGSELPEQGTSIPSGFFYFIKVREGLLIADRLVQTNVAWSVLNMAGYTQGTSFNDTLIPKMTSNIAPSGKVTASTVYNTANYDSWFAFDKTENSYGWLTANGTKSGWLAYEFPAPVLVNKYSIKAPITAPTAAPRQWVLEAFNGEAWILLHIGEYSGWTANEEKVFFLNNQISYSKYRLNITQNDGHASYTGINELTLSAEAVYSKVRSITGGIAYLSESGNPSNIDYRLGAYPENNEWDTYMTFGPYTVPETNDGNDVWHFNYGTDGSCTWASDTVFSGFPSVAGFETSVSGRTVRGRNGDLMGYWSTVATYTTPVKIGFRPVIEYSF